MEPAPGGNPRIATSEAEVAQCLPIMRQLRPHLASEHELVERWRRQREAGYRFLILWDGERPVALAGFRTQENLLHGNHLYVDDLVTDEKCRGRGHGRTLLDWIKAYGRARNLPILILDTPLSNTLGHRFYYREGLLARALRFSTPLTTEQSQVKNEAAPYQR
jgi:GNAT superfamily N-acetyltransferase